MIIKYEAYVLFFKYFYKSEYRKDGCLLQKTSQTKFKRDTWNSVKTHTQFLSSDTNYFYSMMEKQILILKNGNELICQLKSTTCQWYWTYIAGDSEDATE